MIFSGFEIRQGVSSDPGGRTDQNIGGTTRFWVSDIGFEPGSSGTQHRTNKEESGTYSESMYSTH
jgi:hypothetical protein